MADPRPPIPRGTTCADVEPDGGKPPEPSRRRADDLVNDLFAAGLNLHAVEEYLRHHSSEADLGAADRVHAVIDILDQVIVGVRSAALEEWVNRGAADPDPRG